VIKYLKILFLLSGTLHFAVAQQNHYLDSLRKILNNATREDTSRVIALSYMADYYGFVQFDSSLYYATKEAELSDKLNFVYGKFLSYRSKFFAFNVTGNFPMALQSALSFDKTYDQLRSAGRPAAGTPHYFVGLLNLEMGDYPAAISNLQKTITLQKEIRQPLSEVFFSYSQIALVYLKINRWDSALLYAQQGYDLGTQAKVFKKFFSLAIGALGTVHVALHHYKLAEDLFRYGIEQSGRYNNIYFKARNYNNLASLFQKENLEDSAIYYSGIGLRLCQEHNFAEFTVDASDLLTQIYSANGKTDSALKYMGILLAAKDSVFSQSRSRQFSQLAFNEILSQQKIETDKERYQNKIRFYFLLAVLIIFSLLAFLLYRNNRQKQKAKIKIEKAYSELKSTQSQLIQSEKMASLGELTAGIAHEIQNPLNFVNNFSEVNTELIDELEQEAQKGNLDEVRILAKDIKENEEKINHHGRRAAAIVKGMLQHSQSSTGVKEATDINALAEEYLRLSYHGARAKDKELNATLNTDLDKSIGKINIIPQDIGRVLLNLYNNAFYAVNEIQKAKGLGYEPTVSVTTKRSGNQVSISVSDNGNGITQKVVDKIFQPFFTTKPTGQGTGLGLSLSYDIIKAHGGEIKVVTKEGEGSEFIIAIPIT
jgi:two-component system, NtrC family, sensor kinase